MKFEAVRKLLLVLPSCLIIGMLPAQTGYKTGDMPFDFPIAKILNYSGGSSSLARLNDRLLILDFFGTWCAPCIRALPKLAALQKRFQDKIRIMLVADEPEQKLQTFIIQRPGFVLPVVVDEENNFAKAFQPPAYPYTVVMNSAGKIIAIPSQEQLSEAMIEQWLEDTLVSQFKQAEINTLEQNEAGVAVSTTKPVKFLESLSEKYMYAARTGEDTEPFRKELASVSMAELQTELKTDEEKKAFWINLYNAFTQTALKADPDQFKQRGHFFRNKQFEVAGKQFSLDDIEHGILRRSRVKWSLGYFGKLFPGKVERSLRVKRIDYRIHFALNCGAKSCPPIGFYTAEKCSKQLDQATRAYLRSEAEYDSVKNILYLPALMGWFRADFGGKKSMRQLAKDMDLVPKDKKPGIRFKPYDWTIFLQHYN